MTTKSPPTIHSYINFFAVNSKVIIPSTKEAPGFCTFYLFKKVVLPRSLGHGRYMYFLLNDLSIFFIESTLKLMEQLFSTSIFHGPMIEDLTLLVNHGVQVHCFEFAYKGTMTMSDIFRDQSFTCLMADLSQDILNTNRVSSFFRCLNGAFPWMNCSKKWVLYYPTNEKSKKYKCSLLTQKFWVILNPLSLKNGAYLSSIQ